MTSIEPGLSARWRDGGLVALWVRATGRPDRLRSALALARADIAALDGGPASAFGLAPGDRNGPSYVSPPVTLPDGMLVMIDFGATPAELIRTVPDLVLRRLTEAGVVDAVIGTPPQIGARYGIVRRFGPASRCWLRGPLGEPFGDAPRQPPVGLLAHAAAWLRTATGPAGPAKGTEGLEGTELTGAELTGTVISAEVPLSWSSISATLAPALAGHAPVTVVYSDFATVLHTAAVDGKHLGTIPQASFTTAGAALTPADLAAASRQQREAVRGLAAQLVWAGATVSPDARDSGLAQWIDREPTDVGATGGRPPGDMVADLLIPDGMWYQILSPGHLDRLGGPPAGARPLPGGRVELTVGEPEQWVPGHPDRSAVLERSRALLAPCLVSDDDELTLTRQRTDGARARDMANFFPRRPPRRG